MSIINGYSIGGARGPVKVAAPYKISRHVAQAPQGLLELARLNGSGMWHTQVGKGLPFVKIGVH
jgi:hypothetical protein